MNSDDNFLFDKQKLRETAEAALARQADAVPPASTEGQDLLLELQRQQERLKEITGLAQHFLYDLRVHEIELEMQNETLREAQTDLEISRDRYADLYEFAPVGYLTLNSDGMVEEGNLTAAKLLGIERPRLLRCRFTALVVPEDQPRWMSLFLRVKNQGASGRLELTLLHRDGLPIHVQVDCRAKEDLTLGPGRTTVRVVLQDITTRKQAEEQLRFAASVFFHAHEGMILTKTDGEILDVNAAFTTLTGYSRQESLGKNPRFLDSGRHGSAFFVEMWNTLKENGQWTGEIQNRLKNGELVAHLLAITAVPSEDGLAQHYIGRYAEVPAQPIAKPPATL